jgi:tetratricopeptide (TPR) repeat protein
MAIDSTQAEAVWYSRASMPARPLLQPSCSSFVPRLLALGVGVTLLTGSIPAIAAPAKGGDEEEANPTETRAMNAYREGQEAYDAGEYSKALELFLEAQSLYPSPDFHYNIAKCHEALESYEQALVSYKAYLRSYNSAYGEDPDDKVNIDNKIERLEKQIEAEKAADEAERNKEPEVIIKEVPGEGKPKKPGQGLIIAGGVLTGVGIGAAILGAAVYGPKASAASAEIDEIYSGNPNRVTLDDARDIDAEGRRAELNQILMISLGSAIAVTGVALLAVGVVKKKKAPKTPTVTPAVGPDSAGLVIQGRF